jgi:NAD(P)-dependent dehydrogenase (short-subunit alcohol dehydrogenase family)
MRDFAGKTAFVTGGASGIGLALCRVFAEAGIKIMLTDIEKEALDTALASLEGIGTEVRGVLCDVADPVSVDKAAEAAFTAFGRIHIVCNNAGVGGRGGIDEISLANWRWVLDVNLMGVVHGVRAFVPHIRAHGEGGHIVNTASMAGMVSARRFAPYPASKFAVVAMSEGLANELEPFGIGVTVVCPGFVRTRIMESARNRPERYGLDPISNVVNPVAARVAELVRTGMDPQDVASQVLAAIRDNQLYVFTHPERRGDIEERFQRILAALDKTPELGS